MLDSCANAQAQAPIPYGEEAKRCNAALEQVDSSSCAASFRHDVQVSREGAAACLLPACSTLSDCPLCRTIPRRAGRRDHHHHHGHRGQRHRPLRASRRYRGRLFARSDGRSQLNGSARGTCMPPGGRDGGPATVGAMRPRSDGSVARALRFGTVRGTHPGRSTHALHCMQIHGKCTHVRHCVTRL